MAKKTFIVMACILFGSFLDLHADSLQIDTDYRIRGISYQNTDFNKATGNDSYSYYSQKLQLSIKGVFSSDVEICSKITALGVAGSTRTVFSILKSTFPYEHSDFVPYIENVYLKMSNFAALPLTISIGKQSLEFGDGLLISDNGQGYFTFLISADYSKPYPWHADFFTAKIKDNLLPDSDQNLYGALCSVNWKKHAIEVGYFENRDFSGSLYYANPTKSIIKGFYDFRIIRKEKLMAYQLEYAQQKGSVMKADNTSVGFAGYGYVVSGKLMGERTKLGKVTAKALLAISSGDENTADSNDTLFSPDFTKRYDGLERVGYGKLFAASPFDTLIEIPASYSGINTLNVGADFSPWYAWTIGVDYFLYSASQGPKGAPTASGFERIFGAEFALGIEMDLSLQYVHSKYFDTKLSYSRYTPPKLDGFWITRDPASYYQLEMRTKF